MGRQDFELQKNVFMGKDRDNSEATHISFDNAKRKPTNLFLSECKKRFTPLCMPESNDQCCFLCFWTLTSGAFLA